MIFSSTEKEERKQALKREDARQTVCLAFIMKKLFNVFKNC